MKIIPKNENKLIKALTKELGYKYIKTEGEPDCWVKNKDTTSPEIMSYSKVIDFIRPDNFFVFILPEINGLMVNGVYERSIVFEQAFGGLFYARIHSYVTGGTNLVKTSFPKPVGEAGCIAWLLLRGYVYNK